MRKVYLDELPKRGIYTDWENTIGYNVQFIYDEIDGVITIVNYNKVDRYISFLYNDKNYGLLLKNFKKCEFKKVLLDQFPAFKFSVGDNIKDNNRNIIITSQFFKLYGIKTKRKIRCYNFKCCVCGWEEGTITEDQITNGTGCACCCNRITVPEINSIYITDKWMIPYLKNGINDAKSYTKCSSKRVDVKCPICGRVKEEKMIISDLFRYSTVSCICKDGFSYPNKFMYNILEQLHINFISEYSPDWIKPKRYDFYFELNDKKYIVEMDGGLGHGNVIHSKSKVTRQQTIDIDTYKNKMASEHNIEMVRIDCKESDMNYIKSKLLNSVLIDIFQFENVNWLNCHEFALDSLVKKVCEYKELNKELTTNDIAKEFNINYKTVRNYLKYGTVLGWCNYDVKQEIKNKSAKAGRRKASPIEVYKDGELVGTYESAIYLVKNSIDLFGTKFSAGCVSLVCNNKQDNHRGYTFKHISNEDYINS